MYVGKKIVHEKRFVSLYEILVILTRCGNLLGSVIGPFFYKEGEEVNLTQDNLLQNENKHKSLVLSLYNLLPQNVMQKNFLGVNKQSFSAWLDGAEFGIYVCILKIPGVDFPR